MTKDNRVSINLGALESIVSLTKSTADRLINNEVEGILKRPKTGGEIVEFNGVVEDILFNKLRKKLGV